MKKVSDIFVVIKYLYKYFSFFKKIFYIYFFTSFYKIYYKKSIMLCLKYASSSENKIKSFISSRLIF